MMISVTTLLKTIVRISSKIMNLLRMFYEQATIASSLSEVRITARVVIFQRPIRAKIIGVSAIVFFHWTLFQNLQFLPVKASA